MFLKMNLKRSVINWGMAVSVIISTVILFRSYIVNGVVGNSSTDILTISIYPLAMSGYVPFAALFPVLPYGFSYLEEKNSGFQKYIFMRTTYQRYMAHKIFFTGFAGGLSMVIPFIFVFWYAVIVGQPVSPELYPQVYTEHIWGNYMFIWGGMLVLLFRLILFFLFGFLWAEVALLISVLCSNRYVTFVVPFIIYQALWMLLKESFLVYLNPAVLWRSDFGADTPLAAPFIIQTVNIFIVIVFIIVFMRFKLKKQ